VSISRSFRALLQQAVRGPYGCRAWIAQHSWILNKDGELERFAPNPLQSRILEALELCLANNWPVRILGLKKRQGGLTTVCAAIQYWLLNVRTTNAMVMGGLKWQSGNVWKYIRFFKDHDTFDWGNTFKLGEEIGAVSNGSALQKGTAKQPESCRSAALRSLHCTEVARWATDGVANAERILTGAMASLPKLPWTFAIWESSAAGPTGMFYKRWSKALSLEDVKAGRKPRPGQFIKVFAGWHEHEDSRLSMTPDERSEFERSLSEEERALMNRFDLSLEHLFFRRVTIEEECNGDPQIFKREYPFTPEEAFSASSASFFPSAGLAHLRKLAEAAEQTERRDVLLHRENASDRVLALPVEAKQATVWIYEPPSPGSAYHISADFMEGLAADEKGDDRDHHVVQVWRGGFFAADGRWRPPREVARTVKPCRFAPDIVEDLIENLAAYYGDCLVIPENNRDDGIIRNLVNRNVRVFQATVGVDERGDAVTARPSGRYGFRTTGGDGESSRKTILNELAAAVRQFTDAGNGVELTLTTVEEMEVFCRNLRGKPEAIAGHHDDSVIAAAIGFFFRDLGTRYTPRTHDLAAFLSNDPLLRKQQSPQRVGGAFGL